MLKEQKLTEKELLGYRQWLSELDEESRGEQGTSRQAMDPDLWRIFDPKGNIGRQIYESYTDEALLEALRALRADLQAGRAKAVAARLAGAGIR